MKCCEVQVLKKRLWWWKGSPGESSVVSNGQVRAVEPQEGAWLMMPVAEGLCGRGQPKGILLSGRAVCWLCWLCFLWEEVGAVIDVVIDKSVVEMIQPLERLSKSD